MGTSMKVNRYRNDDSGETVVAVPTLIENKAQVSVGAGSTQYVPINVGYNKYEIRTVSVVNDEGNEAITSIYDRQIGGDLIYKSLRESSTYDILNVPCQDKDSTSAVHLFIQNLGSQQAIFTITIKATNLQ